MGNNQRTGVKNLVTLSLLRATTMYLTQARGSCTTIPDTGPEELYYYT